MSKGTGREAIRLWFEFLQRAHADQQVKVNTVFYRPWGDFANQPFKAWWEQHSASLFPRNKVEIVQRYLSDAGHVKVSVPMSLTPTAAANQLREQLIRHYSEIGHEPKAQRSFALTQGVEVRVSALRGYLHVYDIHQKLAAAQAAEDKVPAKQLLAAVRCFYLDRTHKWRNTKRRVEGLPMALAGDFVYSAETKSVTIPNSDDAAIRNLRRYLSIATKLVENAGRGDFPGVDFYK